MVHCVYVVSLHFVVAFSKLYDYSYFVCFCNSVYGCRCVD